MGLLMYRASSPTPTTAAPKPDPTATARSPIRRAASRTVSTRERRRSSTNAESLFLSSQSSSPQLQAHDTYLSGNRSNARSSVTVPAPESTAGTRPLRDEERADALPFVHHTGTVHHSDAPSLHAGARNASNTVNDSTRRMQVTRQRATRRASLEAEIGRFVVRPILNHEGTGTAAAESATVDPRHLFAHHADPDLVRTSTARPRRFGSAPGSVRTRWRQQARSRSPNRRSAAAAPRIAPPGPTDGLGDRRRSPSVEVEESDWETLRATIQPDEQLPSASSSFTSASASSNSSDAQTASGPSSAATSAASPASSFYRNHRYVLPTAECLDITTAQRECGVVCDDARDAQPPFATSRAPSRHATREPSADRPRTRRQRDPPLRARAVVGAAAAEEGEDRGNAGDNDDDDDVASDEADSTAPAHLRLPTPAAEQASAPARDVEPQLESGGSTPFDFDSFLRTPSPERSDRRDRPQSQSQAEPEAQSALGQRLAEVQLQWHQLRRINELLRCGQEVPGWLWEVAGLAPDLQVRDFDL